MFFDSEGIADRYVEYLLEKMAEHLDGLYIVCNGKLREPEKLRRFTEHLFIRPNVGFDAAAWQYLLCGVIPRTELEEYDELILWNDTFYGPVYPLEELFGRMEQTDCDFWGISAHAKSMDPMGTCPLGYWPAHIQTYFLAVRRTMFLSPCFAEYWRSLPLCASFEETVGHFEAVFTRFFSDRGFRWRVYARMEEVDAREPAQLPHYYFDSYEMLVRCRSPFYKKKNFISRRAGMLGWNNASFTRRALRHIISRTEYDETMIYENLLRLYDVSRLIETCGLYEIPYGASYEEAYEASNDARSSRKSHSVPVSGKQPAQTAAVFAYLHDPDFYTLFTGFLRTIPPEADVYVGTDSHGKADAIRRELRNHGISPEVRCLNPAGSGLGALLIGFRDELRRYDVFAFVHDELRNPSEYYTGMLTAVSDMWEAVLGGAEYVRRVIRLFGKDPFLGLLVPPLPVHGAYYHLFHHPWGLSFRKAQEILERLGIRRRADPDAAPVSCGNIFWCRRKALRQLLDERWEYREFTAASFSVLEDSPEHAIAKILPCIAQENGFFTRILSGKEGLVNGFFNNRALLTDLMGQIRQAFPGDYGVSPGQFLEQILPGSSGHVFRISTLTQENIGFTCLDLRDMEIRAVTGNQDTDTVLLDCMLPDAEPGFGRERILRFFVRDPYDRIFVSDPVSFLRDCRQDGSPAIRICLPYRLFRYEEMPCRIGILCRQEAWFSEKRVRSLACRTDSGTERIERKKAADIRVKAGGISCAAKIESVTLREDYLDVRGYAFVRNRFHFDYEPELVFCADGAAAVSFGVRREERWDLAAANPGIPYLVRAGFRCRPFKDDLERGHTYSVVIRLCHVRDPDRTADIRTNCRVSIQE